MDIDETWKGKSNHGPLQVLLLFGHTCPEADQGREQKWSPGVPFFNERAVRLQQQTECIAMI